MKQFLEVQGTQDRVANLEVNIDTVYVRSNIQRIETSDFVGWQYDEIQYDLSEYQELVGEKTEVLQVDVDVVAEIVAMTVEDTVSVAELVALLLEQNMELSARVEALENGNGGAAYNG